jgi:hypothetical protein
LQNLIFGTHSYRPYKQARAFARSLKLKAVKEWYKYVKSGKKPFDIPASPNQSYADEGWTNWADWLGADLKRRGRGWRPFKEARAFVRRLNLKSSKDWRNYYISGRKPNDIPSGAQAAYKADWISWGDWLGTDSVSTSFRKYRPFKKARAFARGLNLESAIDWKNYAKSGKKPDDIPTRPDSIYADAGWAGLGDWLGTGRFRYGRHSWQPFNQARAFARSLSVESVNEWKKYARSNKKPNDIPSGPYRIYADSGWISWSDWLGLDRRRGNWRSFEKARVFARSLGLKSKAQWSTYCDSKRKPNDIPANPYSVYADNGWVSWRDWFGTDTPRKPKRRPTSRRSVPQENPAAATI